MSLLEQSEQEEFRAILEPIYGSQVQNWTVNVKVLELLEKLLQSSERCSRQMDLVPRPFIAGNVVKWASKQARDAVLRVLKRQDKQYYTCLRAAGLKYQRQFQMAALGI